MTKLWTKNKEGPFPVGSSVLTRVRAGKKKQGKFSYKYEGAYVETAVRNNSCGIRMNDGKTRNVNWRDLKKYRKYRVALPPTVAGGGYSRTFYRLGV